MRVILSDEFALLSDSRHYSSFFYMRQRTSITGSVRWLVGWSVTHLFDDPHGAPYWPTWPFFSIKSGFRTALLRVLDVPSDDKSRTRPRKFEWRERYKTQQIDVTKITSNGGFRREEKRLSVF